MHVSNVNALFSSILKVFTFNLYPHVAHNISFFLVLIDIYITVNFAAREPLENVGHVGSHDIIKSLESRVDQNRNSVYS